MRKYWSKPVTFAPESSYAFSETALGKSGSAAVENKGLAQHRQNFLHLVR
jgi:hypothetical protein